METPHKRYTAAKSAMVALQKRYEVPEEVPGDDKPEGGLPGMTDSSVIGTSLVKSNTADCNTPSDQKMDGEDKPSSRPEVPSSISEDPKFRVKKRVSNDPMKTKTKYDKERSLVRGMIEGISKALMFRADVQATPLHGLKSGDLDEGSLADLALREEQPRVWQRDEIQTVHDVAVYLLMDESGSMGGAWQGERREWQPRHTD